MLGIGQLGLPSTAGEISILSEVAGGDTSPIDLTTASAAELFGQVWLPQSRDTIYDRKR
jgi:hypothetical protein